MAPVSSAAPLPSSVRVAGRSCCGQAGASNASEAGSAPSSSRASESPTPAGWQAGGSGVWCGGRQGRAMASLQHGVCPHPDRPPTSSPSSLPCPPPPPQLLASATPAMPARMSASATTAWPIDSTSSPVTSTPHANETSTAVPHHTPDAAARPSKEMAATAGPADSTKRAPESRPQGVKTWVCWWCWGWKCGRAALQTGSRCASGLPHRRPVSRSHRRLTRGGTASRARPLSAMPSDTQYCMTSGDTVRLVLGSLVSTPQEPLNSAASALQSGGRHAGVGPPRRLSMAPHVSAGVVAFLRPLPHLIHRPRWPVCPRSISPACLPHVELPKAIVNQVRHMDAANAQACR